MHIGTNISAFHLSFVFHRCLWEVAVAASAAVQLDLLEIVRCVNAICCENAGDGSNVARHHSSGLVSRGKNSWCAMCKAFHQHQILDIRLKRRLHAAHCLFNLRAGASS